MQYLLDEHEYRRLKYEREKLDEILKKIEGLSHQIFAEENFGGTFSLDSTKKTMREVNQIISKNLA